MAMRAHSQALVFALVFLAVNVEARALACSCARTRLARTHLPIDRSADVPTDVTLRVFLTGFSRALRTSLGAEYQLRDSSGAIVPLDVTVVSTRLDLRPRSALRAGETYTLEQLFVFGVDGTRLTDDERVSASAGSLRGAFFPVSRFITTAPAPARSLTVRVSEASLTLPRGGGDCGPGAGIAVEMAPTFGSTPHDVIELRVRTAAGRERVAATGPASEPMLYAGDLLCMADPEPLPAGQRISYRVVLRDVADRELGSTPWRVVSSRLSRRPGRRLRDAGVPAGWSVSSQVPATLAIATRGPAGCEHGLEELARVELVATGAPSSYGERSMPIVSDGRLWSLHSPAPEGTSRTARATSVALDAPSMVAASQETRIESVPDAVVSSGAHAFVLARRYEERAPTTATLSAIDLDAQTPGPLALAWQIPFDASAGRYRMALGERELAIAYGRRPYGGYSESLSFVFIDPRDGHETGPALHTAQGLDTNAEGASIAHVGGRFVVVWPSASGLGARGPLRATYVSSAGLGTIVDLPIASYSPPDLVSAGSTAGLATASPDGRVELSVIGPDGALIRGPFLLSRGVGGRDNRLPRVAWDGQRFAVLWGSHRATGAHVVVVDEAGHVSAPLRVDRDGVHAAGLGIVATPTGFVVTYTAGYGTHGMAVSLRCRAHPAAGAPIAIAPAS